MMIRMRWEQFKVELKKEAFAIIILAAMIALATYLVCRAI
jgi:hypothetical protein